MSSPATLPSASSSKKPKRGRSPSTPYGSTSPSSYYPPKPLATPHPLFRLEDDPDSDIILQSSDHKLLWIPSYYVKAYSSVFEDVLRIPQPASHSDIIGGLPVIKLEEKALELELLLRFIHRRFRNSLPNELDEESLDSLFKMADKYDIPSLTMIAKEKLILLSSKHPPTAWGLATIYGLPDVAEMAMRQFDHIAVAAPKFSYTHQGEEVRGTRPYVPSDVPVALMARVPIASLRRLMKLHNSVVYQDINWDDIASEF